MIKINDLPLQDLFEKLCDAGFVLGIDDYELLLQALMAGFGLSKEEPLECLERLCKTLWVKSPQEMTTFEYCFQQVMSQKIVGQTVTLEEPIAKPSQETKTATPATPQFSENQPPTQSNKPSPSVPAEDDRTTIDSSENLTTTEVETVPDITLDMEDEVQVAQTKENQLMDFESERDFLLFSDYLPVTKRQMKQIWRYLRRPMREGLAVELDVEATARQIAKQGFFLNPVLVPRRMNRVELVLLLDIDGSMVAFHSLGDRLKETAVRGGRLGRSQIYYFHNCPIDYLYQDPGQQYYQTFDEVLSQLSPTRSSVLIFSDAGAARGAYSTDRLKWTYLFLQQFQQQLRYMAWLNPVPQERWLGTTAGEIAKLIPMFECDRAGLQNAVKVLRGNWVHY